MNITPVNSGFQPPFGDQTKRHQVTTKTHYRRRDTFFSDYSPNLDRSPQAFIPSWNLDPSQITTLSAREDDQGILDQENQNEKFYDPERPQNGSDYTEDQNEDNTDSNSIFPIDNDEDDVTEEDDDDIISEPTREIDDPYRKGHADRDSIPPIQEEFPNPRENTETNY